MSHSRTQGSATPDSHVQLRRALIALALVFAALGSVFVFDRHGDIVETAQAMGATVATPPEAAMMLPPDESRAEAPSMLDDFRPDVDRIPPTY